MIAQKQEEHVLYRFFDHDGDLLYVGITRDPSQRIQQHSGEKDWWGNVSRIEIERHPSRDAVLKAERIAIEAEAPRYNITFNGSRGGVRIATQHSHAPQLDDGLVGSWFLQILGDDEDDRMGQIIGREDGYLIAQLYLGGTVLGRVVPCEIVDVLEWSFYPTPHHLNVALGCQETLDTEDGGFRRCKGITTHSTYDGYRCIRCAKFYPDATAL